MNHSPCASSAYDYCQTSVNLSTSLVTLFLAEDVASLIAWCKGKQSQIGQGSLASVRPSSAKTQWHLPVQALNANGLITSTTSPLSHPHAPLSIVLNPCIVHCHTRTARATRVHITMGSSPLWIRHPSLVDWTDIPTHVFGAFEFCCWRVATLDDFAPT